MRILIIGGSGLIGSELTIELSKKHDVVYTFNKNRVNLGNFKCVKLDITHREALLKLAKDVKPDLVVNTTAVKSVDQCETDKKMAYKVHVEGTKNVLDACLEINTKIIYISTAFVFDGKKDIYYETDLANPINYYGKTKLEAENLIIESGVPFLIVRTDQLYGWCKEGQKENEVVRAWKSLKVGKPFETILDWYNTPTLVYNAVEVIKTLIDGNKEGIYHVVGSDYVSRYECILKVADIFGFDKNLVKYKKSTGMNLPAKRPNVRLSNEKVEKETGIRLLGIGEGLKFMYKKLGNYD